VLRIEQLALGVVERLPRQIDLKVIDAPGLVRGLKLLQAVAQCGNVGELITNHLRGLQQADVAAGRLRARAARKAKALGNLGAARGADASEAADADACESFQTTAAKHTTAPAAPLPRVAARDHVQVKTLSRMFHLPT